jgi:hypothetical protein
MSAIFNQENVENNKKRKSEATPPRENQKADTCSPRKLNTIDFEQKVNRPTENTIPEEKVPATLSVQPARPETYSQELQVQKRNPKAKIPVRGSAGAAGYDLTR